MPSRHVPVRPNLDQLRRQAKDLLKGIRAGDPDAVAEFTSHHPRPVASDSVKLVDAQRALARSYGVSSWQRLVLACHLTDAIWNDDIATVKRLVLEHPRLLREDARGVPGNWGPPMSYAANVGRDAIVTMLHNLGAQDVQYAFERACLQGKLDTARILTNWGAKPEPGSVMGPCETFSGSGLSFLLEQGAQLCDEQGDTLAPIGMLLETYCRNPAGKHQCFATLAARGVYLPETPPMALHQGRIDLLERHLSADPGLLQRTFDHEAIYPRSLGCHEDTTLALHGTPVAGGTLLHLAVDFDEIEIARWLLKQGADVNARASRDSEGFGGHTALFGCVVSQPYRTNCRRDNAFARLLLDAGADTQIVASLRKRLRFVDDESEHLYRDVTPLLWGKQFHDQAWVNPTVMQLLESAP